jgi:hypothetical protein
MSETATAESAPKENCGACLYYRHPSVGQEKGKCFREPPKVFLDSDFEALFLRPSVWAEDFCGFYYDRAQREATNALRSHVQMHLGSLTDDDLAAAYPGARIIKLHPDN